MAGVDDGPARGAARRSEQALAGARYLVALPALVLLLAALGAFVYGIAFAVDAARKIVDHPFPIGKNIGFFVALVDLFLVGVTLLIAAAGLYELFVAPQDATRPSRLLPAWLVMRDLNDLKARVISMIVLVSAVSFVELVVDFQGGRDVLYLGSGVALVIGALTVFLRFGTRDHT